MKLMARAPCFDKTLWPAAREAQESRRVSDPWEETLAHALDDFNNVIEQHGDEQRVSSRDLIEHVLKIPAERQKTYDTNRLSNAMRAIGWSRPACGRVCVGGKQVRGYSRILDTPKTPDKTPSENEKG